MIKNGQPLGLWQVRNSCGEIYEGRFRTWMQPDGEGLITTITGEQRKVNWTQKEMTDWWYNKTKEEILWEDEQRRIAEDAKRKQDIIDTLPDFRNMNQQEVESIRTKA